MFFKKNSHFIIEGLSELKDQGLNIQNKIIKLKKPREFFKNISIHRQYIKKNKQSQTKQNNQFSNHF
ncbi:unnamed protein product (macronuclear) [Paramecium tetraurelia]|uniref:Uncharacterized protein n=1 Tax=Paramecium tetraurelia TaxID=5888 RepID=A0EHR5_PARTE|nr:uncharacterized protein GSPATT00027182001 [Paramecium tetraurelia]CAK94856.1 unnamed protein product [Paramecium tetraurelia]|eukprot:XP_001462229.1 hypothetical protein (macronuclear) [Paramecium tetraurelia strain d4-2]